jgi:hypothetical protein
MTARKKGALPAPMPAIEIAAELRAIVDGIIERGGECDDATYAALQAWQAAIEEKAESLALVKERLEADQAYYRRIEEAAKARRRAAERAWERLRGYLAVVMREAGVKSIRKTDGLFSIALMPGRPSVVVEDSERLPMDLVDVVEVLKPRTDAIMARLQAGEDVPGARLDPGEEYVAVRLAGAGKSNQEED